MDLHIALIDGNSLLYRAFYALPLLETPDGVYTNAVYGFLSMMLKVVEDYAPTHMAVAFDLHGPTFRHKQYEAYKAGRKETPPELIPQGDLLRQVLEKMGIQCYALEGYEADDILGTVSRMAEEQGGTALLVTGDRDSFQLISDRTQVAFTRRGLSEVELLGEPQLKERYGVTPWQVPDLKGLMGDSSDNIPGIAGIGEKTALKLLEQFGNLNDVLDGADQLKGKLRERVENGREVALMSRQLATIDRNIPLKWVVDDCKLPQLDSPQTREVFAQYEFRTLLRRLNKLQKGADVIETAQPARSQWQQENVLTAQDAQVLAQRALKADPVGFCLHSGISVAFDGVEYRFPVRETLLDEGGLEASEALAALKPLLCGDGKKILFDAKHVMTELKRHGIALGGAFEDVMITQALLESSVGKGAITSAAQAVDAWAQHEPLLAEAGAQALYRDMELPLVTVLFWMEQRGFTIDTQALRATGEDLKQQMASLEQEIYLMAGHTFNVLSPKQLGVVLFDELGLPAQKKTKTGYSTDAQVLESLQDQHAIIEPILGYRALSKLYGTYIDGLISKADAQGKIHTTFYQTGTTTGRLSSADPNLQNIPVRTEQGRVIRKVFVPGNAQRVLVDADYSQIELRVLAHMSGDENFIRAFHMGEDIHTYTAAEVFGVPLGQVTGEMRSSAKAVNFGIVYGISDFGLARNIGVSRKEAAGYIERFFERYPKVKAFMDACVATAKMQGYVSTMFGRRRPIPELASSNYNTRSFGERAAMNTPIQGTAADLIKIAMVRVDRALEASGVSARLILQVHDELIVEAPEDEVDAVAKLLKAEMEAAAQLDVPLVAQVKSGRSWYETK